MIAHQIIDKCKRRLRVIDQKVSDAILLAYLEEAQDQVCKELRIPRYTGDVDDVRGSMSVPPQIRSDAILGVWWKDVENQTYCQLPLMTSAQLQKDFPDWDYKKWEGAVEYMLYDKSNPAAPLLPVPFTLEPQEYRVQGVAKTAIIDSLDSELFKDLEGNFMTEMDVDADFLMHLVLSKVLLDPQLASIELQLYRQKIKRVNDDMRLPAMRIKGSGTRLSYGGC